MYFGFAMALIGLCVYFANPLALLAALLSVAYISRFQIIPEERARLLKFGGPDSRYVRTVRRWI